MRLAVAVCLTLVTAVVEARPSTVPADSPKVSCQWLGGIQ
jgi:hypothetical protein